MQKFFCYWFKLRRIADKNTLSMIKMSFDGALASVKAKIWIRKVEINLKGT